MTDNMDEPKCEPHGLTGCRYCARLNQKTYEILVRQSRQWTPQQRYEKILAVVGQEIFGGDDFAP